MADREGDPWAFSWQGKAGGSELFIGGVTPPIFLKLQKRWSKGGYKKNGHGLFCDIFY